MEIIMGFLNICQNISIYFILFSLRAGCIYQAMLIENSITFKINIWNKQQYDEEL